MKQRRQRRSKDTIVALAGMALLMPLLAACQEAGGSDPEPAGPPEWVHVEQFQAIADEHGDRAAGTSGYEAAAEYVEEQLDEAGYDSTRQYFTFELDGEQIETFNILAEIGPEDSAEVESDVIMLGAHLDGVPGSPAINDNASGSAALLEAASRLSGQEEIVNTVRFAWWGAEEYSTAHGSGHYVSDLEENDPEELESMAAYINADMLASPNYVIGVYNARDSDSSLEVPEGSQQIMQLFTDHFEANEQEWVPTTWDMISDQRAFVRTGVPVGGLYTGADGRKSARQASLFGGTVGQRFDPNYHTSDDDLDNADEEALTIMTDALSHAASTLAAGHHERR